MKLIMVLQQQVLERLERRLAAQKYTANPAAAAGNRGGAQNGNRGAASSSQPPLRRSRPEQVRNPGSLFFCLNAYYYVSELGEAGHIYIYIYK